MCLDKVGALMAQKVHDLEFVSAGTPGLDLTWSPSEDVMMMKKGDPNQLESHEALNQNANPPGT